MCRVCASSWQQQVAQHFRRAGTAGTGSARSARASEQLPQRVRWRARSVAGSENPCMPAMLRQALRRNRRARARDSQRAAAARHCAATAAAAHSSMIRPVRAGAGGPCRRRGTRASARPARRRSTCSAAETPDPAARRHDGAAAWCATQSARLSRNARARASETPRGTTSSTAHRHRCARPRVGRAGCDARSGRASPRAPSQCSGHSGSCDGARCSPWLSAIWRRRHRT